MHLESLNLPNMIFGPFTLFVALLGVFHRCRALLLIGDAYAYRFVFQRLSEPVGIIATVAEQPIGIRQIAEQCPCANVAADLPGRHEQIERVPPTVEDSQMACSFMFMPPLARPIGRPRSLFMLMLVTVR